MENLDPNQLPMLPDPTEESASLPMATPAPVAPMVPNQPKTPWLKTKLARVSLITAGAIAVILIVLFSAQIGQLLNLFGTKASTTQTIELNDFLPAVGHEEKDSSGNLGTGLFKEDAGRLMLNNPGVEPPQ